jgi:hypothetical protein
MDELQRQFSEVQSQVCSKLDALIAKQQPVQSCENNELRVLMIELFSLSDELTCVDKSDQWRLWALQANSLQTDIDMVIEVLGECSQVQSDLQQRPVQATWTPSNDLRVEVMPSHPDDGPKAAEYSPDVAASSHEPLFADISSLLSPDLVSF